MMSLKEKTINTLVSAGILYDEGDEASYQGDWSTAETSSDFHNETDEISSNLREMVVLYVIFCIMYTNRYCIYYVNSAKRIK